MKLDVEERGETELHLSRYFKASPDQVYAAHVDPALIRLWMLGPDGWSMPVCESDPVPGGRILFTWEKDGNSFSLNGQYFELDPPHRIVHSEEWSDDEMDKTRITTTFAREGDGTRMTLVIAYPSAAARKKALETGMIGGMEACYVRLDAMETAG